MITLKLKYKTDDLSKSIILDYMKQYSSMLHFVYNRKIEGINDSSIKQLTKSLNNISLMNSWFSESSLVEAKALIQSSKERDNKKVIFGGKKLFFDRMNNKISKEEFKIKRLNPVYSVGDARCLGNRFFRIENDLQTIIFKPNRQTKLTLTLNKLYRKRLDTLKRLYLRQQLKNLPITYKLDLEFVYISFDETEIFNNVKLSNQINNRVLALDMNPNYIGWSVVDWLDESKFNVIKTGVYSIKYLNDKEKEFKKLKLSSSSPERKKLNNKRRFEVFQISKELIKTAIQYQVELVAIEDLKIKSQDNRKGKKFNKLVNNNWIRTDFINNLQKRCNIFRIKFLKVKPGYSSFIGNLAFRSLRLPDMILASIEVGRRGYEFNLQYIKKIKEQKKNIVLPFKEQFLDGILMSLEELGVTETFKNLKDLYDSLKKSDVKYRFQLSDSNLDCFRFYSKRSLIVRIE